MQFAKRNFCTSVLGVALLVAGTASAVVTPQENRTAHQMELLAADELPRCFVKGDQACLRYDRTNGPAVFAGGWGRSHLQGGGFRYQFSTLKFDRTPPPLPKPGSAWREAVVLGRATWVELAEVARQHLAPSETNAGVYFQTLASEAVLYRDTNGMLRTVPLLAKPAEVTLVARYGAAELTLALARLAEERVRARYPAHDLFCVAEDPGGRGTAFLLLDFERRSCVLLNNPQTDDDPRGGPQIVATVRSIASLAVESHGVALLKGPVSSTLRLANMSAQSAAGLLTTGIRAGGGRIPPLATNATPMNLEAWEDELDDLTDTELEPGRVEFLVDGERFFPRLMQRIAEATNRIHFEVCIFDTDDVAVEVADALKRRSRDVQVRVLYDLMTSQASALSWPATPMREGFQPPASIRVYLEEDSGVAARPFLNPWFSSDHNKILTFDGWVSYLGGMNIGREYRYEWHDLMAEITGPVVGRFEREFRKAWAQAGMAGDFALAEAALVPTRPLRTPPGEHWAALRRLHTRTGEIQIRKAVVKSLSRAQQRIWLENPYLYDPAVMNGLIAARARGVDVRVVLPSENDLASGKSSNLVTANTLVQNGVRVFLYPGMTHVKALVADGWATFGSANFNKLSLRTNQETNLATSNARIVDDLARQLFEVDFAKSRELTEPIEVSWTDQLADSLLTQF